MAKEEMYELLCKDRFDRIDKTQEEMLAILRGHNGNAGLIEEVRWIKKIHKVIIGLVGAMGLIMCKELVYWIHTRFF